MGLLAENLKSGGGGAGCKVKPFIALRNFKFAPIYRITVQLKHQLQIFTRKDMSPNAWGPVLPSERLCAL
jgi:hypothetical protein